MPSGPLRLGLLQCGHVHPDLIPRYGDYPELFADLFRGHDVALRTYATDAGELPAALDECDAWLVSGSANSAYEDLPWIPPLEDLLRRAVADEVPMVAICFGHQVLAQALGGEVARSPAGWGVGIQTYEVVGDPQPWMDPPHPGPLRLLASHQDQVVRLPEEARLLVRSPHCGVAGFTVGSSALALQPHPEFVAGVSRGLTERRRHLIGEERADEALASLAEPPDAEVAASWMVSFLRSAGA